MSDDESSSDYDVEQYIQPTVKRSTYNNTDDTYLEEEGDYSVEKKEEESDEEVEDESTELKEQCVVSKEKIEPIKKNSKTNVEVKDDEEEEEPVRTNNRFILHISNFSEETTRDMLTYFFSEAGRLKGIRMPRNRKYAFVEMMDFDSYKNALKFDGREIGDKKIRVLQGSKNKKHSSGKSRAQKRRKPIANNNTAQSTNNYSKRRKY